MPMTCHLADVEALNAQHPMTFGLLSRETRESVQPGEHAKLIFHFRGHAERMWVYVTERTRDGGYVGTLDNDPAMTRAIAYGDRVAFRPEHVADVYLTKRIN